MMVALQVVWWAPAASFVLDEDSVRSSPYVNTLARRMYRLRKLRGNVLNEELSWIQKILKNIEPWQRKNER